jgi:hypothetical protein
MDVGWWFYSINSMLEVSKKLLLKGGGLLCLLF